MDRIILEPAKMRGMDNIFKAHLECILLLVKKSRLCKNWMRKISCASKHIGVQVSKRNMHRSEVNGALDNRSTIMTDIQSLRLRGRFCINPMAFYSIPWNCNTCI